MRKSITTIFTLTVILNYCTAQVTISDIVKLSLGRSINKLHPTLDSLGVWYHMHFDKNQNKSSNAGQDLKRIYSISDSKGSVKVYAFKLDTKNIIEEIIINFRHDSREHVEDAGKIKTQTSFHVGQYSTDMVFTRRK